MRLKQKAWINLAMFAILLAIFGGTVAHFATTETARNVISAGEVKVALYELSDPAGYNESSDSSQFAGRDNLVPFQDIENVVPGVIYSKIPFAENIDTEPVWIRVQLTLAKTTPEGTVVPIPDPTSVIELVGAGEKWELAQDGYYYYNAALKADELTEPMFRGVKFRGELNSSDSPAGTTYSLTVSIFATQAANNGTSAKTANWTEDE